MFLLSFIFYASPSLESDYENNDFIGLIKIISNDSYGYGFVPIQVWKTNFGDYSYFKSLDTELFEEGETYLLFATAMPNKNGVLLKDDKTIIYQKKDIPKETLWFLTGQPCINPSETAAERIKKFPYQTGACNRSGFSTICGCNGKTYTSECEAHKDGVIKYKKGECPSE